MKYLFTFFLSVFFVSFLSAGQNNPDVGSRAVTSTAGGKTLQRIETVGERNPLPLTSSTLEKERSVPLPKPSSIQSAVRWTATDAAAIANDVTVNGNGGNPFVGWNLNSPRVSFFNDISAVPLWEHTSSTSVGRNYISLSANSNIVANGSYQDLFLFDKTNGNVTFDFQIPNGRTAGPTAVSRDGSLLVCATVSPLAGGTHRVYAFNPPSATPIWTFDFSDNQSTGVYGINISIDKATVIVNGKFYAWVLNAANGSVRTQMDVNNTESRIAMSSDASVIGVAELSGFVRALNWSAAQNKYNQLWQYKIPPGAYTNWASAVDISADGTTLVAGSLIFLTSGYDGSIYMFDTFGDGTPNWIVPSTGDEVSQVALSDDGSIAAVASWGDISNTLPDIYVFERSSNTPVFTVNTPGSIFSIAISADGRSIAAGGKAVHARTFGSGGNAYDIGVDLGGGSIAGTVTLAGTTNYSGAKASVVGTNRSAVTDSLGRYVVKNVPAGTYQVKYSKLGYIASTLSSITVSGTDTTHVANVALTQTGSPVTNLTASHGQNSKIVLGWTPPPQALSRLNDRLLAADEYLTTTSIPVRPSGVTKLWRQPTGFDSPVPPDSIRVYRSVRSGGPYSVRKTIPGTLATYTDSTAVPLKDYYYRVTAIYGQGESVYSNEAYGTVDSSFLQFSITAPHRTVTPTIDGTLSPGEWSDALKVDVSDVFGLGGGIPLARGSVFMYFKYDSVASKLYIAGEDLLNTSPLADGVGFGLYFDDNDNKQFEPLGTDSLLREGNYWAYYFGTGSTVRFREIYTGGGVNAVVDTVAGAQTAFSVATGHAVGEVSIPISFFNKDALRVFAPGRKVGAGLFMISRSSGNAVFHGWWPQTMASVFTPTGFGEIQIPIRLSAPPKAPTNVAAVKQGNYIRVTWSDPTQGLNNDPITAPLSLQLYRNGTLLRTFASGVQAFTDSNVSAQGWYEYKLRGSIVVSAQTFYGPYSSTVGTFAVTDPQLTELGYDDGVPEGFYVVNFTYDNNKFAVRFTPRQYPAKVYRVKAFTNNGFSPIQVSIHSDSSGFPGPMKAGPYTGESFQSAGVDSFIVTLPGVEPPVVASGDFYVVLSFLPSSPGAPGIGGDNTPPIDGRSMYYETSTGWVTMTTTDLIVRAFLTGQTSVANSGPEVPLEFALKQNYPNPFNPSTKINFQIAGSSFVTLKVYDVLGKEVATLVNKNLKPGSYSSVLNADRLASGVYFYRLQAGSFTDTKRMLLLK